MFCISSFLSRIILEDFSRSISRKRMAGRAIDWLMRSSRPSAKGNLLILHYAVDVKRLVEEGKEYPWPKPHRCPGCQGVRLWGHGYVFRYFEGLSFGVWMKRFRCPDCGAVHSARLQGFDPGFHYSRFLILISLLSRLIQGRWLRCLARQAQQYWYRGLRLQASRWKNCRRPALSSLRWLLRQGLCPSTHRLQCEILRL